MKDDFFPKTPPLDEEELKQLEEEELANGPKKRSMAELLAAQRVKEEENRRINEYLSKPSGVLDVIEGTRQGMIDDVTRMPAAVGLKTAKYAVAAGDALNRFASKVAAGGGVRSNMMGDRIGAVDPKLAKQYQQENTKEAAKAIAGIDEQTAEVGPRNPIMAKTADVIGSTPLMVAKFSNPLWPAGQVIESGMDAADGENNALALAKRIRDGLGSEIPEDKRDETQKWIDTIAGAEKGARSAALIKFFNFVGSYAPTGARRVLAEAAAGGTQALAEGGDLNSVIEGAITQGVFGYKNRNSPQRSLKRDIASVKSGAKAAGKYIEDDYRKAFFGLPANAVAGIEGGGGKPPVKPEAPKDIAEPIFSVGDAAPDSAKAAVDLVSNMRKHDDKVKVLGADPIPVEEGSPFDGGVSVSAKDGVNTWFEVMKLKDSDRQVFKMNAVFTNEGSEVEPGKVFGSNLNDFLTTAQKSNALIVGGGGSTSFDGYRMAELAAKRYKDSNGERGQLYFIENPGKPDKPTPVIGPKGSDADVARIGKIVEPPADKGYRLRKSDLGKYQEIDDKIMAAMGGNLTPQGKPAAEPPVVGKEAQGNSMLDSVAELVDLGSPMSEAQKQFYRANKDAVEARIQELFPETPEEDLTYNDEDVPVGEAELDVPPIATKVPPVDPGSAGKRTELIIKTPSPEETDRFDDQYIVPSVKAAAMDEIGDATRSVPVDPDAEVIKRATERIDRDGVENVSQELLSRADEKYDNTDAVTGLVAINKLEIGDPVRERLIQKLSDVASKFGQNLRAFGILDPVMYPDIVQRQAHKEAEREDVGLRKRRVKADEEIKKISDNINNVNKETAKTSADDIARETEKFIKGARRAVEKLGGSSEGKDAAVADLNDMIDSMLAQKITRGAGLEEQKPPTESDRKVANEVAQTIYSAISDLAGRVKLKEPSRDDKDLARISTAIQSNEAYAQSLVRAKKILQEKFAGDANAQKVLELIFNSKLIRPFSLKVLDRIVGNEFRSMGGKLSEIIKQHYTAKDSAGKDLEQTLIAKMGLSGEDAQRAAKFIQDSFGKLTNAAKQKALEALYKKRGEPRVERGHIDKVIELSNLGALDRSSLHDIVSQRIGLPVLTKEHMAKLNKVAQEAQSLPEFSEGRIQKEAELASLMFQDIPESKRNKLLSYRKVAMLLSFKSAFRNAIGGASNVGIDMVAKGVLGKSLDSYMTRKINEQLASEGMRQTATKQMTKTDIEMVYREAKKALSFAIEDNFRGVDTMRLRLERDMNVGKPREQWVHIGKLADKFSTNKSHFKEGGILNKAQKATGLLLSVPDRAITEGTFRESIANQMKANKESGGTGELTQEMVDQAWREATEVTYRDVNRLSDAIVKLQQHTGTIGELLLTFPRVSANLAHRALVTYSPVGMYRGMRGARKMIKEGVQSFDQPHKIYKGQVDHYTQRRVVMDASRGATGTAIWGLGAILGYLGTATGARDDDTKAQKTKEAIGKRSSGFNLFGHNVSYDWLMPMASVMGVGVEIGKKLKGDGVSIGGLVDAVAAGTGTMLDQPIFTGISRAIGGRGTPAQKFAYGLSTIAEGVGASLIPTAVGQLRQAIDPYKRKIRVDTGTGIGTDAKDIAMSALRMMVNKIPGLSYVLPKERNILGQPMKYHQSDILGRGIGAVIIDPLDRFLNPGIISDLKDDPGIDFVLDLDRKMKKIGGKSPLPKDASRTNGVIVNGKRVILTIRQRDKYRKKVGIESHNYIDNFYREGAGDGMTPQEQAETIYRALAQIGSENLQDLKDEIENEQK